MIWFTWANCEIPRENDNLCSVKSPTLRMGRRLGKEPSQKINTTSLRGRKLANYRKYLNNLKSIPNYQERIFKAQRYIIWYIPVWTSSIADMSDKKQRSNKLRTMINFIVSCIGYKPVQTENIWIHRPTDLQKHTDKLKSPASNKVKEYQYHKCLLVDFQLMTTYSILTD